MADNTYRILTKIAETGSLTRTAEQLNYTQARVSQILKSAEKEFGLTLFVRGKRGVMPTPECRCLLPVMQELVRQEQVLLDQMDQIRDLRGGTVSIGTFTSVSCHWLPRRLKAFGQLYPQIRFQLKLGDVAHIDQWLREGTVDLGLMIDPGTEDLTFLPLLEDCYSVILPREHPLAGAEELSLEQLREECFILLEPEDNAPVEPQLRQAGVRVGYRVKDDYTILAMVESGLGVSVLPHLLLQRTSYRVHAARLMPSVARRMGILLPKEGYVSLAARQFVSFLRQEAEAVEK